MLRSSINTSKKERERQRHGLLLSRLHPTLTATSVDPVAREMARVVRRARQDQPPVGRVTKLFMPLMKRVNPEYYHKYAKSIADEASKWKPYDILDAINDDNSCGRGCYFSPGQQEVLLRAFEKAGYFSRSPKLDTSSIAKYADANPRAKPPVVITYDEYDRLITGEGYPPGVDARSVSRSLSKVAKTHHLVFIVFAHFGKEGEEKWYCKSNLFSFLMCLRHRLPAMRGRGLLVVDPSRSTPRSAIAALPLSEFETSQTPLMLCNIIDGVHSGLEESQAAEWWSSGKIDPKIATMAIFTPIAEFPCPLISNSQNMIVLCSDGNVAKAAKKFVPLVPALCVPSRSSRYNPNTRVASFVLPFKISDEASLGEYFDVLTKSNPQFVPSYRMHKMCNELVSQKDRNEAEKRHLIFTPSSSSDLSDLENLKRNTKRRTF